ncbi:glycosyltransferase [Belliella kenyensis]|nr:glycosyltransferase [Belliella kenyensis]
MQELAPICLFTFNRLEETKRCVDALRENFLAHESELIVFSDGPKNDIQGPKIEEVRAFLSTIDGFKKVTIIASKENKGLAKSIIEGVTSVLKNYPSAIILEDDLVVTPNFLDFMNEGLSFYKSDSRVISISGYTLPLPGCKNSVNDFYFGVRASSWGWGIWRDRWEAIDWEMKDYDDFIEDSKQKKAFNMGGSDMVGMLKNQKMGRISSWAIRFCFHQFQNGLVTVFPTISKLYSIGFSKDATHTKYTSRFDTEVDTSGKRTFKFEVFTQLDPKVLKEFRAFFSIKRRLLDKINAILK